MRSEIHVQHKEYNGPASNLILNCQTTHYTTNNTGGDVEENFTVPKYDLVTQPVWEKEFEMVLSRLKDWSIDKWDEYTNFSLYKQQMVSPSSPLVLTWTITLRRPLCPRFSNWSLIALASFAESTVSTTNSPGISTILFTLFRCKCPMKCHRISWHFSRI